MTFLDPGADGDPLPRDRRHRHHLPEWFEDDVDDLDDDRSDELDELDELDDESWDDTGPDDDLPMLPAVPLRTPGDVLAAMLLVVGPERCGPPALWFLLLDADDRPLPLVLPVCDLPARPDEQGCVQVVDALARIVEIEAPGGSVAVAYVRASGGDRGAFETAWDAALTRAATQRGVTLAARVVIGATRARVLA